MLNNHPTFLQILNKYEHRMSNEQEVPSNTTEARAKQLGATITWYKHHAKAYNFPTRAAAELFRETLEKKGYAFTVHNKGDEGISIHYHAPEPWANVLIFNRNKNKKEGVK
jgi:hypothetical protein